jgi:hypothetical protein
MLFNTRFCGEKLLLTPTIEKIIFLSSAISIFVFLIHFFLVFPFIAAEPHSATKLLLFSDIYKFVLFINTKMTIYLLMFKKYCNFVPNNSYSNTMKKILTLFLALSAFGIAHAVTYVYNGRSTYSSDILFTWDGKHLYQGRSTYSSDIILTFDGRNIYAGNSTYSSDILANFDGEYFFEERSTYSSDILAHWDGLRIYKGRSSYSSDILYTYNRQYVFRGNSTYSSDILLTIEGVLPIAVLITILL